MRRADPALLAAGLVVMAVGLVLCLDAAGALSLSIAWLGPLAAGAIGMTLLVTGLTRR